MGRFVDRSGAETHLSVVVFLLLAFAPLLVLIARPSPASAADVVISQIVISDVEDRSFAVSWVTDQAVGGFVSYGADPEGPDAWTTVGDARGTDYTGYTHFVVVENGDPGEVRAATAYYLMVGSGSATAAASWSARLSVTTGPSPVEPAPTPIFFGGVVRNRDGSPAGGVLVRVTLRRVVSGQPTEISLPLAGLTDDAGAFAVDVSRARVVRASSSPDFFLLSTSSGDELVSYELDAGRGNRAAGTVAASALAQAQQLVLPTSDLAAPDRAVTPTSAVVVTIPPPVAPSSTPSAAIPTRTPAAPTVAPLAPRSTPAAAATPAAAPSSTPPGKALAAASTPDRTPEVKPSLTPASAAPLDYRPAPPAILGVLGAAVLLVAVGLALVVVGLIEARGR